MNVYNQDNLKKTHADYSNGLLPDYTVTTAVCTQTVWPDTYFIPVYTGCVDTVVLPAFGMIH